MWVGIIVLGLKVFVIADVARLLGAFALLLERLEHRALDDLAAGRVDRMSDVGVARGAVVGVARRPVLVEFPTTLVTEARPQMLLAAALQAAIGQLAARHGHKRSFRALD